MEKQNIKKFIDDVKDAFEKAIGTSSSANQERDERTVENYVRESGNVNTIPAKSNDYTIGGNNMSDNTTEPDPKGATAVQKDLPNASRPAAADLVDQQTSPDTNVSVSDAPNNDSLAEAVATGGAGVYKGVDGKCETCGQAINKADDSTDESKVEKAAADDEISETSADDEKTEKSVDATENTQVSKIWKGSFSLPKLN